MSEPIDRGAAFGPNVWLIDEMYRQYAERPESVSESWREFFSDYRPGVGREVPSIPPEPAAITPEPPAATPAAPAPAGVAIPLRGPVARLVENMEQSLAVPTATSVRAMPVKLLEENRALLNQHLAETQGGKVSFTHFLAWAIVRALQSMPELRSTYQMIDGVPHRITPEHVNLGLAVDVQRRDGTRMLVVPNIKQSDTLAFPAFFAAYNDMVRKAHANQLVPDDFQATNVTLTNPGMIGTTQSMPRLMAGQSCIIATGSIDYPPEFQAADARALAEFGVSKVITLTCTYDHRVIQGAESGAFLGRIESLLSGEEGFYEEIFASLHVPHRPMYLARDANPYHTDDAERVAPEKQAAVLQLINMYRVRGHLVAHLNPLGSAIPTHPELELEHHGLTIWDLDRVFFTGGLGGRRQAKLREIIHILRDAYCGDLGIEYMHMQEHERKTWIQQQVEGTRASGWLDSAGKRRILDRLNVAEAFERFLQTKYVGHKRFSLEGAEVLIPMLDRLLTRAVAQGIAEVTMGMSHRGRLNVLANVVGKSYEKIFHEFEGDLDPLSREGTGDVKYHLGASGTYESPQGGSLHITLASNPSHLEAVDPVVEGMTRAAQDLSGDALRERALPLLIHGDAAFAGQGVVAETLNMSALSGYGTGGTIHVVVDNGIGFTTSPESARSSVYATDVAKMVQAPIFHVNGDDPEACVRVMDLAFAFRQTFKKDVVVDVICYRRHGHNEADEPAYTQPLMYEQIRNKRSVRKLYTETLVNRGDMDLAEAQKVLDEFQATLDAAFAATKESAPPEVCLLPEEPVVAVPMDPAPPVPRDTLATVLASITTLPEGFHLHPKLRGQINQRRASLTQESLEWGTAEALAFGSLLLEGIPLRLSGQDSRRGTFSQRHAVFVDQETGEEYIPLQHLDPSQAPCMIYDSLLSEYAVLGFEYGYSVARPDALVLWEAQFGDFSNGAQIIVDQFIAAAGEKWGQGSRLTLLLPHGYEGQGPEHSSARLERFLSLCARGNMRVAVPTTAAQYYHLLRAQAHSKSPTPLVVMTPKSLLRAEAARSRASELADGAWQVVIPDSAPPRDQQTVLLCSGKVAYDLLGHRQRETRSDVAVVRVEQLYPFPGETVKNLLGLYSRIREIRWVQEEPQNMGAWAYVEPLLRRLGLAPSYAGRAASASPATGSQRVHQAEQEKLISEAFRRVP
ncbi:MAG: multifunctional oxoglutarate decarboxylase/oxoglutarate dehydrogenase thiamine pyrophosphate-binding subunit/dihydrolipoyllysine-residue succinyltransferase subunit [Acidobacteriota bacterium]